MKKITRENVITVSKIVVGVSVSFTVNQVLKQNIAVDQPHQKVQLAVGCFALGAMAAEKAEDYIAGAVNEIADHFAKAKITATTSE